jgi:hypothetical protein
MAKSEWFIGEYQIGWLGASPIAIDAEVESKAEWELCDFKLSDGGVLSLRYKDDGKLVHCSPHTWSTISQSAPAPSAGPQVHPWPDDDGSDIMNQPF